MFGISRSGTELEKLVSNLVSNISTSPRSALEEWAEIIDLSITRSGVATFCRDCVVCALPTGSGFLDIGLNSLTVSGEELADRIAAIAASLSIPTLVSRNHGNEYRDYDRGLS
jgi:hypothetical protein